MLNPSDLESIAKKVADILPQGVGQVPEGVQSQVKAILSSSFAKMDLVTREEFDVQSGVLAKTRAKLEALEKQLTEIEEKLNQEFFPEGKYKSLFICGIGYGDSSKLYDRAPRLEFNQACTVI